MKNQRIALITGANVGIGRITALSLSRQGYRLFLAGRSQARTQSVIDEIRSLRQENDAATFLPLQLDDLESVKNCADLFLKTGLDLHLLVNNAGLAGAKGQTQQGFELAFGVNHLGHFLLTVLLMKKLTASAPARVVTVASRAHLLARSGINWDSLQSASKSLTGISEYAVSKLANILFNAQLAKELAGSVCAMLSLPKQIGAFKYVPLLAAIKDTFPTMSNETGRKFLRYTCV